MLRKSKQSHAAVGFIVSLEQAVAGCGTARLILLRSLLVALPASLNPKPYNAGACHDPETRNPKPETLNPNPPPPKWLKLSAQVRSRLGGPPQSPATVAQAAVKKQTPKPPDPRKDLKSRSPNLGLGFIGV